MRKIYLVYSLYYLIDEENGDGKVPMWCCDSLDKAQASVRDLRNSFLKLKKELSLNYDINYGCDTLEVY